MTTFAWFNAEIMQNLSLLYIVKLFHGLIHNFVNLWKNQGFPENYVFKEKQR